MDREAWNKRDKQHYKSEDFVPKEGDPVTVSGGCASISDRRRDADIWAYNTETSEMVQVILHPNPDPTINPEEIVRDHLVPNYVHVIYFFAELTMTEV